jgi:pyruvate formate lyase activating enzyme
MGCNFSCSFCQNWHISQVPGGCLKESGQRSFSPAEIVREALDTHCLSIAYTYTEPTVFFEFARACCEYAKDNRLKNIFVTNGFMSPQALNDIGPYLDAANIDLKGMSEAFYQKYCHGRLQPVCDTIVAMKKRGIWIEITTLIIPGLNDDAGSFDKISSFIASLDKSIPWHISRFHPEYKCRNIPPTDFACLQQAFDIGRSKGLMHVYVGNCQTDYGQHTVCSHCKKTLIERDGFFITRNALIHGTCGFCGTVLSGVYQ